MKFLARHRATLGTVGVIALTSLFVTLAFPQTPVALEAALFAAAFIGLWAIARSPYWKVIYKESPLRRAVTGMTDLDERELALRDRANGLTYYLFATVNLVIIAACSALMQLGKLALDGDMLQAAIFPYAFFAATLPVIMLEWFEPSYLWSDPVEDEA